MRKEIDLKGERERGVLDGIVGLGLSRGILSYGLAKPAFFPVQETTLKLGLEQIRISTPTKLFPGLNSMVVNAG